MVALLKSNGAAFMKPFARLARGQLDGIASSLETLKPSLATKCCFLCSVAYVILPWDLTYILMAGVLVAMKAGPLFGVPVDVLAPLEAKYVPIVFGGQQPKAEEKKE